MLTGAEIVLHEQNGQKQQAEANSIVQAGLVNHYLCIIGAHKEQGADSKSNASRKVDLKMEQQPLDEYKKQQGRNCVEQNMYLVPSRTRGTNEAIDTVGDQLSELV